MIRCGGCAELVEPLSPRRSGGAAGAYPGDPRAGVRVYARPGGRVALGLYWPVLRKIRSIALVGYACVALWKLLYRPALGPPHPDAVWWGLLVLVGGLGLCGWTWSHRVVEAGPERLRVYWNPAILWPFGDVGYWPSDEVEGIEARFFHRKAQRSGGQFVPGDSGYRILVRPRAGEVKPLMDPEVVFDSPEAAEWVAWTLQAALGKRD